MFDDLKIRNKLVLLVAGPIVIIVLLAALGARSRQETADQSRAVEALVAVAQVNSDVVDALQHESLYSSAFVGADRDAWQSQVKTTRQATDAAMAIAIERLKADQAKGSAAFRSSAGLAIDSADKLAYIRDAVDQGYRFDQVASTYGALQDTFLATNLTVADAVQDPQVASELRTAAALAGYKAAIARQAAILAGAAEQGGFTAEGSYNQLVATASDEASQEAIFSSIASTDRKGEVRDALTTEARVGLEAARDAALEGGASADVTADAKALAVSAGAVIAELHEVESNLFEGVISASRTTRTNAERAANLFLVVAGLAILAAITGAVLLGRRITRPLNRLADAADHLAQDQMPKLVESLRNPAEDEVTFQIGSMQAIEVDSKDEIGRLATSFNEVQRVAGEVAAEQAALLRKGIGEMFVNLARRNQALLDRQIEFIDELERGEEDPDQLENLYRLDHLATRMRRNAESLLVLAGAEPPRRRGRPAPLANVVRAALAEVEDFGRIELLSFDEVLVASNAAADLAHLLSELMENAANFSPPETRVEVVGHRTKADGYVISVTDHGIGMSADQISEANESLAKPPLVGLALSRSLGFIVVGRLATRHGIAVRMMPSPSGGVTAVVSLPPPLVTEAPGLAAVAHDGAAAPSRLTPVAETVAPAESEVAPLTFAPLEVGGATLESVPMPTEATAVPTGPVRAEMGAPGANGTLPTRRLTSAPVMPERTAVPTPVDLTPAEPVLRAAPEPPGVGGEHPAGTAPLTFTDPGPVHDEAFDAPSHLDGPPPAAPPLPSRGPAPTPRPAARTPKPESENKPFFLEEAAPPRLFGRQVEPEVEATPPPAPVPVPAAASVASPPRLFGTQAEPAAPAAPAAPPLARRGSPTSPPASPDAPVARPAPAASEPAEVVRTTAGLAKRTPRPAGGGGRAIPGADVERGAGATRRSPDEVRNLLSRYRDGQQRARTEEPVTAGSTHEEGTP